MLGLVWLLKERNTRLPGDLWLAATVGEEGLGNLKGMHALVDRFGDQPRAYIVLEGMGLGDIYHRGLAVQRYRIRMETAGGHAWIDYGTPSSIQEMACLVTQLAALPVPREPRSSLNIGIIRGGTSINTIAAQAELELDLRSESAGTLHRLAQRVERQVQHANRPGVICTAEIIGQRPAGALPIAHPLVQLAWHILRELEIRPVPGIGSTDANVPISRGFPAICIGLTHGNGAHTPAEIIRTEPLYTGMEQLYQIVTRVWNMQ
jgi:acetylornithine deacetylase/succinyl-diaminopimelate desuccinylase-like protein